MGGVGEGLYSVKIGLSYGRPSLLVRINKMTG